MMNSLPEPPASKGNLGGTKPKLGNCAVGGCSRDAVLLFDSRAMCLDHLISYCYSRLESYEAVECSEETSEETGFYISSARFIDECVPRLVILLVDCLDLSNLERARLLDIVLWANQIDDRQRSAGKSYRSAKAS
jgi:hypothetical protein